MIELKGYLHALQAGAHEDKIIIDTIEALKSLKTRDLSEKRLLVAEVYCQLLQYCQSLYNENILEHEDLIDKILEVFENIELIGAEAKEDEKENSNLLLIMFLHELKSRRDADAGWRIDDKALGEKNIEVLLRDLGNIYFVFDIKIDEKYVFPIHNMIAKVVEEPKFLGKDLDIYQIRILQLAVRLFRDGGEENINETLKTLTDQCNLKFINYLNSAQYIIDTQDLLNYQKNGVMIFCNITKHKVLIRHKSKNYFDNQTGIAGLELKEEHDYQDNIIGFFVEYDLEKGDKLIDYSDILKTEEGRESFLKLMFDKKAYNVLTEFSIIKKEDGSLLPTNPFCYKDMFIVKGRHENKEGRTYDQKHICDALTKYRSTALKVSSRYIMNRVSFGLAVLLLQKNNVGVSALHLNELNDDSWYQSQVLYNWTIHCHDSIEALTFIIEQWLKQNEYSAHPRIRREREAMKRKNIEEHKVAPLDFYPLRSDLGWIYRTLKCQNPEEFYLLLGKVQEDTEGNEFIVAELFTDVTGTMFRRKTKLQELSIKKEQLEDPDGILTSIESGDDCFFLYSNQKQKGIVYEQSLLKSLSALEKMQNANHFTLETACKINQTLYKMIEDRMRLFKVAFEEAGKEYFADFETQVYYRLLHNLLWSEIDREKIESYLNIITHHQILSYIEIDKDEKFERKDMATLYVPKDNRESDSVLDSIYVTYLKSKSTREENDMYRCVLELKDEEYFLRGNRVEHIVFLCDNFERGTATIKMLKDYLNIETEKKNTKGKVDYRREKRQKYFIYKDEMTREEVSLNAIIKKNNCTLEVHGYYGTREGKQKIESFFKDSHMESAIVTYEREITSKASNIIEEVRKIWPQHNSNEDIYTVVREFNMTKKNVFPDAMLKGADNAICMFIKKDEIT